MTRIILARHGNTFRPEETPVWVGARSDLPLVERGIAQAHTLGSALRHAHVHPNPIIAGPLRRTRETAGIVADILGFDARKIRIELRLTEIDYGAWEGKSTAEIESDPEDKIEMDAWNKASVFPYRPRWSPGEAQLTANIGLLLSETVADTSLFVTSNGIMRFFARAAANSADYPDRKVATGHLSVMERRGDAWHILQWNVAPENLSRFL